jgi:DNA-directed RNA polymerase subunit K/omega
MANENKTRYEKTRIISARALQISQGSPILVSAPKGASAVDIAELEWNAGVVPIDIKEPKKEENAEKK